MQGELSATQVRATTCIHC